MRATFVPKFVGESKNLVFDFISDLAVGETISTQVVTSALWSGTDATPNAMISGVASASGTKVTQLVIGGVVGNVYNLKCTITTSAGQTLVGTGLLAVVADAL